MLMCLYVFITCLVLKGSLDKCINNQIKLNAEGSRDERKKQNRKEIETMNEVHTGVLESLHLPR